MASQEALPPPKVNARKRQIYIAASRLFVERGFAGASMSDIAEAVQLTKAGLYHFVASKEELLFEIIQHGMNQLDEDVVQPALAIDDPLERLRTIVRNHIRNVGRVESDRGNPLSIVTDEPMGLSPQRRRVIDARKAAYVNLVRDTLAALQAKGRMRPEADTTVVAFTIVGTIMWTARWRRPEGRLSLDQIVDEMLHNLIDGLIVSPSSGAEPRPAAKRRGRAPQNL